MMLMQAAISCSTSELAISSAVAWFGHVQSVIRVDDGIAQRYRIKGAVVSCSLQGQMPGKSGSSR